MNNIILIFKSLLLISLFIKQNSLQCGETFIDNCKECGKGEEFNSCGICEPGYFPLLENLFCFPCDDLQYGQEGCKGECDGSNFYSSGFVTCIECKEGYYNSEGKCLRCDFESSGCLSCSYEKEKDSDDKKFKCQKCLNNVEYRIYDNSKCVKCNQILDNCDKCHFVENEDNNAICEECFDGFYLNEDGECIECENISIDGKHCYKCSSSLNPDYCWCNPEYGLNSENECESCDEEGCQFCYFDKNNNEQMCASCESNKFIPGTNQCLICPEGCLECEYDKAEEDAVCIKCKNNYILKPQSKECILCKNIEEMGEGCQNCIINPSNKNYECLSCLNNYDYTFINNTFKCISNTNPVENNLQGCKIAQYIQSSNSYECLLCINNDFKRFIPVINSKSCIDPSSIALSENCLEAEKKENGYSCIKCDSNYALIEDVNTQLKNCSERELDISYCLEGKIEEGKYICIKCVNNSLPESNKCSCDKMSFSKDSKFCYKCNDFIKGNPGCDESEGCEYFPEIDEVKCKKCKNGYFELNEGQCVSCSNRIPNCGKCHYDKSNDKVICDNCINDIYFLITQENKCQLNDCEEYPEISPGCIICKDKLNEYKENKKCQRCKHGYFKTNEEICIYCSSEQYGGPACYGCGYEIDEAGKQTNKIICNECYSDYYPEYYSEDEYEDSEVSYDETDFNIPLLSKEGKCYDCQIVHSDGCRKCEFKKDKDGKESLKCVSCYEEYYLNPEGKCINITGLIPRKQNCKEYMFSSGDIQFKLYDDNSFYIYDYTNYDTVYKTIYDTELKGFESKCLKCKEGYYFNSEGICEKVNYEDCSFNSILKNYDNFRDACYAFCNYEKSNVLITLKLEGQNDELSIGNFYYYNYKYFINYFIESNKLKSCLNNSGDGGEYAPENLKYCKKAYYFPENDTSICIECIEGHDEDEDEYYLDINSHICHKINYDSCTIENIGTEINPLYSCIEPYNRHQTLALITYENGEKEYIDPDYNKELLGCVEATANTYYINTKYNCTKCSNKYIPYYNKFYDRIICQNINSKILKEKEFNFSIFNSITETVKAFNGICEKNYMFTPDGENCYKCDNELIGMPGCRRKCNFSLKRNNIIKCEDGCKQGYIESSEGICSLCNDANEGCHECHYENEYPLNYTGIKRKRRFVCDYCEEGYTQSTSGECIKCKNVGLGPCTICKVDPDSNDKYICAQCSYGYFVNDKGQCDICDGYHFIGIKEKKCINCGNVLEGGIDNCLYCKSDGEKAICTQCLPGYILLNNNNSCIEIIKNKELENFLNCVILTMIDNKLQCSKCKEKYSLIKKNNNIQECIYIPTLYDSNFIGNYDSHFYYFNDGKVTKNDLLTFKNNDYIYNRYKNYYPCQEAENLGTEENPLYSCVKCYEYSIEDKHFIEAVKITEINKKLSFCFDPDEYDDLNNCEEATYRIKNGKEEFNCTKCNKYSIMIYNKNSGKYYCELSYEGKKCSVLFCKACKNSDIYYCEECITNYEVNILTGSCVKKTEVIPTVT